jgi:hypothetical protein
MPHLRKQIRDAAVTALTGLTTTAANVFPGRARPLAADHPPSLLIYTTEEASDYDSMKADNAAGAVLRRDLTLIVEGRAVETSAAAIEDVLDLIAEEVEPAILTEPPIGGLASEIALAATRITVTAPGESYAGEIQMRFRIVYRARERTPGAAA